MRMKQFVAGAAFLSFSKTKNGTQHIVVIVA
jgi:hypothetical protein